MSRDWCSASQQHIRISVQITPNAKKSEVIGVHEDALKIRLQAQPIEGKANEALVRFLADVLGVSKSAVTITHGHTNKRKIVEVSTSRLNLDEVRRLLVPAG